MVHAEDFIQKLQQNVNTFIYPMRYEDFVTESRARLGYIWACLDSAKARRDLQSELASVVCNGGTEAARWMVSRHEYENPDNACLIDLYKQTEAVTFDAASELSRRLALSMRDVLRWSSAGGALGSEIVTRAAARQIDSSKRRMLLSLGRLSYPEAVARICSTMRPNPTAPAATISFVSLMPAVAMVSDLVKRRLYGWRPGENEANVLIFDTLSHPGRSRQMRVSADRDCLCQSQLFREAFDRRQRIRQPHLNRMFRSASLALLPDNLIEEAARRKKEYAGHFR